MGGAGYVKRLHDDKGVGLGSKMAKIRDNIINVQPLVAVLSCNISTIFVLFDELHC